MSQACQGSTWSYEVSQGLLRAIGFNVRLHRSELGNASPPEIHVFTSTSAADAAFTFQVPVEERAHVFYLNPPALNPRIEVIFAAQSGAFYLSPLELHLGPPTLLTPLGKTFNVRCVQFTAESWEGDGRMRLGLVGRDPRRVRGGGVYVAPT